MSELLKKAFDPELFRQLGHQVVELIANQLTENLDRKTTQTIPWTAPEEMLKTWEQIDQQDHTIIDVFQKILDNSTHIHHPKYIAHQVAMGAPIATLASMLSAFLNNGMAIYEMGIVSTCLEKIITDQLAQMLGFGEKAAGILTSGGTLANLTALLSARKAKIGSSHTTEKLALMVSEQAHYCIERAVLSMGWHPDGMIKIPVDSAFGMRTELLESYYEKASSNGFRVIAIVGSACTTSTGSYDNLNAIADFCEKKELWFHVDGAHGAAVVYSEKYKHLISGIERANSVVLDYHKLLMTPALATALIYKDKLDSFHTFQTKAAYLLDLDQDWHNTGKRTYECTKLMMSVKVYSIIKTYGNQIFTDNVNRLYDMARVFEAIIKSYPVFEIASATQSNIICFRYIQPGFDQQALNMLNRKLRQSLLEDGEFYIVQTVLNGMVYLRLTVMNPFTNESDLRQLLSKIMDTAMALSNE